MTVAQAMRPVASATGYLFAGPVFDRMRGGYQRLRGDAVRLRRIVLSGSQGRLFVHYSRQNFANCLEYWTNASLYRYHFRPGAPFAPATGRPHQTPAEGPRSWDGRDGQTRRHLPDDSCCR
ncbi:hypothetical protein CBM2586_B40045 [Cupriavidus phytorum]|uniref:Uncharacterized protein n=1 Tax=Cupriavidus taiwanensis TaxID=164546 RepID=A0A975XK11_9BURK|nr:hypothetical protein CBM2586_B40045 [Cupriavidus taiwanensis]